MKVLMPAKCGSSPLAKVGIDLSVMLSAPGRPMSRAHCTSLCQAPAGSFPSASAARQPWLFSLS